MFVLHSSLTTCDFRMSREVLEYTVMERLAEKAPLA